MSNIERGYKKSSTLASETLGRRITKGDGQVNSMSFMSPLYAEGVCMADPSDPIGFAGKVPDTIGYFDNPTFLKSPYGRPSKSKKRD